MKSGIKLCLRTAWLTAAIVVLLMGTDLCNATDEACFQAGETMSFFMFLLSFPTGTLFVLISIVLLDFGGIHHLSNYITVWLIMTCGGYLQWFIVLPRLFAKPDLTVLNLRANAPADAPAVEARQSRRRSKQIKSASAFDRRGRTPLERVIARHL